MTTTVMTRIARGVLPAGLVLVAGLAAACGGGAYQPGPPSQIPSPPAMTSHAPSPPAATPVTATLTDLHIALSTPTFTPGVHTFHAVNNDDEVHSLEINGPGVSSQALPSALNPGQSGDLTVTLQPGTYEIYCPVDGHKAAGMDLTITVAGAPSMPAPTR
ncbi:hypothetical protein ABZ863_04970 [Saccharomonospora sp. NPDC046836]|uniref:hypothetical protein n=1 Tax=Saccharomonospora sp. NPDC046836 TaxID=3156921 RepID=UPI0033E9321F